jgi:hypothetical protein
MKQLRYLSLLILVLAVGFAGCSVDISSPANTETAGTDDFGAIDLDLLNGGLTPTDEEVAFGDAFLLREEAREAEELYDDALLADLEVAKMVAECDATDDGRPARTSYFLRLVWGDLDGPVDEETGEVIDAARVDWSGALQIDRGAVIVRRVIRFERGVDSITRPRPDPQTVEWTSFTGGHFDGILVQIIEPAPRPDDSLAPDYEPNRIRVKAGAFSAEFLTSDIPGLDRTADVGDDGSIHFTGYEYNGRLGCPRGFLAGIWRMAPEDADFDGGFFRGRWVNIVGTTRGYMQGRYGMNSEGHRVFAGKYISRNGHFLGFLRGTWAPGDEPGRGYFRGEWVNEAETREGVLGGRYKQAGDRPGGFYQGRWTADCDREAVDAIE